MARERHGDFHRCGCKRGFAGKGVDGFGRVAKEGSQCGVLPEILVPFHVELGVDLLTEIIIWRKYTPQSLRWVEIEVEFLHNHARDPRELGDCFCQHFASNLGFFKLMVGNGGGKGDIRMIGKVAAESGVLDYVEKTLGLASFQAEKVEKKRHAVRIAGGVEGEEEEAKFGGSLPCTALGKVLDVSPAAEEEFAVLGAAEGDSRLPGGEVGEKCRVQAPTHCE